MGCREADSEQQEGGVLPGRFQGGGWGCSLTDPHSCNCPEKATLKPLSLSSSGTPEAWP